MKVLVVGGGGFIGKKLIEKLRENNEVICSDKKIPDEQWRNEFGVECKEADVTDKKSLKDSFKGVDIVYHLAAILEKAGTKKETYFKINFEGVKNSFEVAKENNVKQFVYCSSASVGGPYNGKLTNEESPMVAVNDYQRAKVESENFLFSQDFPVTIVRPELAYGAGDMHHLRLFQAINGEKFHFVGSGKTITQPTYFSDIIQGFQLVLNNQKAFKQKYIIGSDDIVSINEFCEKIAEILGKKISPFFIPGFVARAVGWFGDFLANFGIDFPLHTSTANFFLVGNAYDNSKTKKELGFKPEVGLEEGLKRAIEWYKEKGLLK